MNRTPKKNPARWVAAAVCAPASIALFGATMAWAAHATPAVASANSQTTTVTSNGQQNNSDPLGQLAAQVEANDALIAAQQQQLETLNAQIAAIQGKPSTNKPSTTPQKPSTVTPQKPAPVAPPATNTTTGGSGK